MALISVGIDHENASLDLLERATVLEHEWSKVLRSSAEPAQHPRSGLRLDLSAHRGRRGDRPLSRGDRRDHAHVERSDGTRDPSEFADHLSVHFDRGVATHLFSVAAGSQVSGAGRVRDPRTTASRARTGDRRADRGARDHRTLPARHLDRSTGTKRDPDRARHDEFRAGVGHDGDRGARCRPRRRPRVDHRRRSTRRRHRAIAARTTGATVAADDREPDRVARAQRLRDDLHDDRVDRGEPWTTWRRS